MTKKFKNGGDLATLIRKAIDKYGAPIGKTHINPMLDTCEFEVELENGKTDKIMSGEMITPPGWTSKMSRRPVQFNWLSMQFPTR